MFALALAAVLAAQPVPGASGETPTPTDQALAEMDQRLVRVKKVLFDREVQLLRADIDALEKKIAGAKPDEREDLDAAVVGLTYRLRDLHNKAGLTAPPAAPMSGPRVGDK